MPTRQEKVTEKGCDVIDTEYVMAENKHMFHIVDFYISIIRAR